MKKHCSFRAWLFAACLCFVASYPLLAASVRLTEQNITLATYVAGEPERNPMFYFGSASQGAQGRIYPYPLYDNLTGVKSNKVYKIIYLENEYIRVGILPELGGRLFEGVDKSNGYDFIYRQHVIKPALIGLIGAWISGGIEWNIPHHHRASTFIPVQSMTEENPDGSKTVWVGELELRHRMRWAVGYTLRPGKSYLECSVRILNRTPVANTMLCFANVAVHVNEGYQVIFPPRTQWVTHHAKRDFAAWPIASGRYSGADFGAGTDVSWYTNHYVPNSMFAWNYEDDFFAGYDHVKQAGTMSVADHHVVPGKKFWTWGNGPRGRMWDKILTDSDGPYIELMVGAYSDNQPDYSWLQPDETKSFKMFWYPFRDIGGVKYANLDAAVNLERGTDGQARLGFCVTSAHRAATATLKAGERVLFEKTVSLAPGKPLVSTVTLPVGVKEEELCVSLQAEGKELLAWSPEPRKPMPKPQPVTPPPAPNDIKTVEELYLAGQRVEQFHSPALEPEPFWDEALKRDPEDIRVNTSLGIRQLKQAQFAEAEAHFRAALKRATAKYTSPKDGEPFYYLGVALKAQGKYDEAVVAFEKAAWSEAWRGPSYLEVAESESREGKFTEALGHLQRSLQANTLNVRALSLQAALFRHTGRVKDALEVLRIAAEFTDPLDVRLMTERWLAGNRAARKQLASTLSQHPATGLETAIEYWNAGLWQDGTQLLRLLVENAREPNRVSPLAYYYLAEFAAHLGRETEAMQYRRLARQMSPDYVFPFQSETVAILRRAMEADPTDPRAPYYLGNLLFDWQPKEAVRLWEKSVTLDPAFPIAHRNLAVAAMHEENTNALARAIAEMEKAVSICDDYPIHYFELDRLYQMAGVAPEKRLATLEGHRSTVLRRDDARARLVGLRVWAGKYDDALTLMQGHEFNIWEGGARFNVTDPWTDAHLLRGQACLAAGKYRDALNDFGLAAEYPENLRAEPREGASPRSAEIAYWKAKACEGLGDSARARQCWQEAASAEFHARRGEQGLVSDRGAQRFYQALAQQKLGLSDAAQAAFKELVSAGEAALKDNASKVDFFTSFSERDNARSRKATAYYVCGLGHLGLGEKQEAAAAFSKALETSPDHLGAKSALRELR